MASPWLWGVIAIATWWSWWWSEPPGKVRSSQVATVPAARLPDTLEERREGDGIVHFAGIVGTGLTLRRTHMVLPWSDRVLALVCFVCGCIKRRHGNSVG